MQITQREKRLIIIAAVFFSLLFIYYGINFLSENIFTIDEKIKQASIDQSSLQQYAREYRKLSALRSMEKIDLDPMIPHIESILQKYSVRNNTALQPTDSLIENKFLKRLVNIEFKEIDAASLLNVIREIEEQGSIPYSVEYFQSTPLQSKPGIYRATLKVAAFKNKD